MRFLAPLILAVAPAVAFAQVATEAPAPVKAFEETCLAGGLDPAARPAALTAAGWTKDAAATFDTTGFNISRAIERNFDFSKPDAVEQWSGMVDGKGAKILLASFPEKRRYPHLCALIVDGVDNAMPYADSLKNAFKSFGIGRKSVDLVHYFEFSGKIGVEKHPVRGEVFSRSQVSGDPKSMHIYVAY